MGAEGHPDRAAGAASARVLVVEDEAGVQEVTRLFLEAAGYRVRVAGTAEVALAAFESEPADVVLLDIHLPDGSGADLARRLVDRGRTPGIVVFTGDLDRAREAGLPAGTRLLAKPFRREDLLERVREALPARREA